MISSLELLTLAVGLAAILSMVALLPKKGKIGAMTAAFFAATLMGFAQPATAAAVDDNALSEGQKALNETLKTTPQGNQYQGIEYPQVTGTPLSDQQMTENIKGEIRENLKLSVSSGAVRVSGKVSDQRTAQRIVQDIKEIPGVHEVSYDLGLAS